MDSNLCQNEYCCIDRISDLPDSILGEILSRLRLKDVIATSILSTRWKPLFPSSLPLIKLVDFDDKSYKLQRSNQEKDSFCENFKYSVNKLLNVTLRDVERVTFNLENPYWGDEIVGSWVSASLGLNVKHLKLMADLSYSKPLFDRLHGCKTLVELELGGFEVNLPQEDFMLPNLKKLLLYKLEEVYDDNNSIRKLLVGCPVLDELRITDCDYVPELYIEHPILNKLFIDWCSDMVVIDAPNLEAFVCEGGVSEVYDMEDIGSLCSVCIDIGYFHEEKEDSIRYLGELVVQCSNTTRLCLSRYSVMALCCSCLPLPTFPNLTCLALGRMGSRGGRMLAQFLKSAPNLTVLTFEEGLKWDYAGFQSLLPSLPVCLELHVKKIEIWQPYKNKWIDYFLKNGKVLQELIVYCLPHEITSTLEKLSMLPRRSEACRVLVKDINNPGKSRYSRDWWFRHD